MNEIQITNDINEVKVFPMDKIQMIFFLEMIQIRNTAKNTIPELEMQEKENIENLKKDLDRFKDKIKAKEISREVLKQDKRLRDKLVKELNDITNPKKITKF